MHLFGWVRSTPPGGLDTLVAQRRWQLLAGRRILVNSPYILPKDEADAAYTRLAKISAGFMQRRGLHLGAGGHLAGYLRQAGLTRVKIVQKEIGIGRQGRRQQQLLIANLLEAAQNIAPLLVQQGLFTEQEIADLIAAEREELPKLGMIWQVTWAFGMVPLSTS